MTVSKKVILVANLNDLNNVSIAIYGKFNDTFLFKTVQLRIANTSKLKCENNVSPRFMLEALQ